MYEQTYMQRERKAKHELRAQRMGKAIALLIIFTPALLVGFFLGRLTAPTPAPAEVPVLLEEVREYNPDPCGLEVVVCEGEAGYSL